MAPIRKELGGLRDARAGDGADLFASILENLDALGNEIAGVTDHMMTACEAIQDAADAIAAKTKERDTKMKCKKIPQGTGEIFEACSFQDLTGQRLDKITRTVSAIEDGIREISILAGGKNASTGKGRKTSKPGTRGIDRVDGDIVLEGLQINDPSHSASRAWPSPAGIPRLTPKDTSS